MQRLGPSLVAVSLALAATGCGQSEGPSRGTVPEPAGTTTATPTPGPDDTAASDAGRTLTAADDGEVVNLEVDEQASLIQSDPTSPDPTVTGDAVEVVEVVNVTASGRREWELRAVSPGTTTMVVQDGDVTFDLTIEVR